MFGENCLCFTSSAKIDSKGRLNIPCRTGIEADDQLVLFDNEEYVSIYNIIYADKFFKKLEDSRLNNIATLKLEEAKLIKEQIEFYNSFLLERVKSDNQKRIIIPKNVIEKFGYSHDVILYGEVNHINLFKDEEQLENYKVKVRSKCENK